MVNYISDLARTNLFINIELKDIAGLLECVNARFTQYAKDEMIIEEGSRVQEFGILLSGHARSIKWDQADKVIILTMLKKGSEVGVLLAANSEHESPVSVQALDDVSVLLIPFDHLLSRCEKNCQKHEAVLRNYIKIVAEKGLILHERINCLLKPNVREKILTYLLRVSHEQQSRTISIPLNRNAMAEYLNIERSALSRELSYMKKEGLIDYHMNSFKLL